MKLSNVRYKRKLGFQTLVVYNMKQEISQRPILQYQMNKLPLIYSQHVIICIRHFTSLFPSICAVYPKLTVIAVATQQVRIWHRLRIRALVLLSVEPVFAPHRHLIMLIPAKSASACNTWEPRPSFFTFEKLRWDKNHFFSKFEEEKVFTN